MNKDRSFLSLYDSLVSGDLYDEEQILNWLMTQKDPSGDAIEALEGDDLRSIIEDADSLAIYFCKYSKNSLICLCIKSK